jgi:hypothetical protein
MDEAWSFEHSVECPVAAGFAWRYWTDVNNWRLDPDVESVELHGPFAAGTAGVTISRTTGRVEWRVISVLPGSGAVIEVPVQNAMAHFRWTFEDLGAGTRITQRISIGGKGAAPLITAMASIFESNINYK